MFTEARLFHSKFRPEKITFKTLTSAVIFDTIEKFGKMVTMALRLFLRHELAQFSSKLIACDVTSSA
jgi:hypothetical protein